jgi:hypothetical protein
MSELENKSAAELAPIVKYAHQIQTLEHHIQRALEGISIANPQGGDNLTLDQALSMLVHAYGTHNDVAQKQGLLVGNFRTMLEAYRGQTFTTLERRNEIIQRAVKISKGENPDAAKVDETEKAWEQEVLRKARAEREANKSTINQD